MRALGRSLDQGIEEGMDCLSRIAICNRKWVDHSFELKVGLISQEEFAKRMAPVAQESILAQMELQQLEANGIRRIILPRPDGGTHIVLYREPTP